MPCEHAEPAHTHAIRKRSVKCASERVRAGGEGRALHIKPRADLMGRAEMTWVVALGEALCVG